jgi:hypothetical protein
MSVNAGTKTATSTASTVGVATGREYLRLTNESLITRCRAGDSGITAEAGVILEPGQTVEFRSLPSENKEIYVLSEGAAVELAYYEVISA